MTQRGSADLPATAEGRQYHIGLAPGELAPNVLMVGDPGRAYRVAQYFADAREPITNREYVTITGTYKGCPLSVMATGMGPDNTEMAIVEMAQLVERPTLLRIGTSSGLIEETQLGDVVISSGGVRLENTSTAYVPEGFPAIAHHEATLALIQSAMAHTCRFHVGLTATASGFYGAQGRHVPGFSPWRSTLLDDLERIGVCNFEMEASCLFTLANLIQARAGCICGVIGQRRANTFFSDDQKHVLEKQSIEIALESIVLLSQMDAARGEASWWTPAMGL
jgi:uridine phosphorylase